MSKDNGNSPDPIEQKIAFIINQQAKFLAEVEEIKTRHAHADARFD
jgi:hypothetical protein